jgi:hypothetical protein
MELCFTILIEAYGSPAELIERPFRPNADCVHLVTLQVWDSQAAAVGQRFLLMGKFPREYENP